MHRLAPIIFLFLWAPIATAAAPSLLPAPPKITAKAHLLQDFHSGRVLAEDNADMRTEPASLTKMLTAYVVFSELAQGNIGLDDKVRISEKAWRTGGSRMFVEVDKQVRLEDLLKGMIVQSGNDASVALAEYVAGDEAAFAQIMNEFAGRLGMTNSHFVNATGWPDPEQYTTARDLARLAAALIRDFPDHYKWHSIRKFEFNNITQYNRNKLLWRDESVDGIKTGHTEAAGYCLVASAERDGMRLVSVVMGTDGSKSRAKYSQTLLNYGFRFFETHRLYAGHEPLTTIRVWKGGAPEVPVGLATDLYVTVPRGQYNRLDAAMELDARLLAPVAKGSTHGLVKVMLGEEKAAERPLIALQSVPEGDLWQRLVDHVKLYFE